MVDKLDPQRVPDYFSNPGTVERWWTPDTGPLSFHYDAEVQILDDHLGVDPSWSVLDVGTGRGRFGIHLAAQGCAVTAVDINPEMLEVAGKAARDRGVEDRFVLRESSAEDLSEFGDASFDLVMCMELFDHLPDLAKAIAAMRRVLRPGGRFVFTYVPNESLYGLTGNVYRFLRKLIRPESMMISRTYSLPEVRRTLARGELELDRHFGVGVLCANAQTRLFQENPVARAFTALARAEANRWPYHEGPLLSRLGAHVVGFARPVGRTGSSGASGASS